jgi:soluble lytic murein transglycosylase-like protein
METGFHSPRRSSGVLSGALFLSVFLWSLASGARADIYRCQGPDGSVHYTNSRPDDRRRCRVAVREKKKKTTSGATARASSARRPSSVPPSPDRYRRFDRVIREAARLYQLPEAFLRAVMKVESDFNAEVVSHAGAMGLMQLMPKTAAAMGVRNPFDPRENILGGARYLRLLANKFGGDLVLTVAAYNAGEGAVARYQGVPPYRETRGYVRKVLHHYYAFRRAGAGGAATAAVSPRSLGM